MGIFLEKKKEIMKEAKEEDVIEEVATSETVDVPVKIVPVTKSISLNSHLVSMGIFLKAYIEVFKDRLSKEEIEAIKKTDLYQHTEYITKDFQTDAEKESCDLLMNNALSILGEALNVNEAIVSYQKRFMENFSKEERQKNGKVYTGDKTIIEWIHDKLVQYNSISLNKTYWEPACGTGSFVIDWYDRLMKHWQENFQLYPDIKDQHEAHRWIIEKCLFFSDIDPFAIRLCSFALFLKDVTVQDLNWNSYCGDSLLDEPFKQIEKFDYVAGNPPYVGFHEGELSIGYKQQLASKYSFYHGKGDLLNLFFEVAQQRSSNFGLITSRYWIETKYVAQMRKTLKPQLVEIWDHGSDDSKFSNVATRTACFVFTSTRSSQLIYNSSSFEKMDLDDTNGWFFSMDSILSKISISKLDKYITVVDGIETGCNEVFIIKESIIGIQSSPILSGKDIRKWFAEDARKYLTEECTKEEYDKQQTPLSQYLKQHEATLLKRDTKDFFKFNRNDTPKWLTVGIFARQYTDINHYGFCPNEVGVFGLKSNVYLLVPKDVTLKKQLLAILNSKVMEYFFIKRIKRRANNYMMGPGNYKILPMPATLDSRLDPLVDKMLSDPNDKVTEAEINKIVYELYNLTPDEIKTIEETVK